jgi:hypothetical protein
VGSLLYAITITRPDTARTANKLSEFLINPSVRHQEAVNRAILYLYKTSALAIEYSALNDQSAVVYTGDAAFADNPVIRYSIKGYLFKLFNGPIDWRLTKQKTVTIFSIEAELLALSYAAKEVIWWKRLFNTLQFDPGHKISIQCDNRQTIRLLTAETLQINTKLKHIDIHSHWLRQEITNGALQIQWIPTAEMPADGLTKALPRQKHETFIKQLGLVDIENLVVKRV